MKILVMGDSHSKFLNITSEMRDAYPNTRGLNTRVLSISGATINGFGKRESTLNSKNQFIRLFNEYKPDYICFALGQVDLELGLFYKQVIQRKKINSLDYAKKLACDYIEYIIEICNELEFSLNHIIVKGVNLSTLTESRQKAINYTSKIITENIKNNAEIKEHYQYLEKILPINSVRNMNHTTFNLHVKNLCHNSNIKYFDINNEIIDEFTGNVKKAFIPAFNDHHLVDSLYIRELHIQKLLQSVTHVKA